MTIMRNFENSSEECPPLPSTDTSAGTLSGGISTGSRNTKWDVFRRANLLGGPDAERSFEAAADESLLCFFREAGSDALGELPPFQCA
mmetsp:Transcript_15857/g.36713  ORF Transcript_15857/g.36713 Transcript_15857/m.36713 type:complete len:88 (+) Transcript_15857:562-825(+)